MNNLEGIPYEEVVNDNGVSYAEFRKKLVVKFRITWFHILSGFFVIALIFFLSDYVIQKFITWRWLLIPLSALSLGFWIAYLNLFIHEAGHFYIHPHKKTNDILANIILCSWVGMDIKVYRKMHWQHHLYLSSPSDMETSYFHPLTPGFLLETFTGIHLLRLIVKKTNKNILDKTLAFRARRMLLAGFLINLFIVSFFIYINHWWMSIAWILAMIIFFPFFATVRQVMEHRDDLAKNEIHFYSSAQKRISRLFSDSLFSKTFGPAGFNKHMIHHWDPHLPYMVLKEVETFLLNCKRTGPIIRSSRTTYFSVFKKLFTPR